MRCVSNHLVDELGIKIYLLTQEDDLQPPEHVVAGPSTAIHSLDEATQPSRPRRQRRIPRIYMDYAPSSTSVPEKLVWISSPKDVMDRAGGLPESCVANCTSSPEDIVENISLCSTWRRLRMKRQVRTDERLRNVPL